MASTRESLTLFSQLKPYLQANNPQVDNPPIVECSLCLDDSEILTPLTPSHLQATAIPGVVMLCGHMVCRPCFKQWHDSIRNPLTNAQPANFTPSTATVPPAVPCPICRRALRFADDSNWCRHLLSPVPVTPPSDVPLTVPEGGRAPAFCSDCRMYRGKGMGMMVATYVRAGVVAPAEVEEMVQDVPFHGSKFGEEEIRLAFPAVVTQQDPVGYVLGVIRADMQAEERNNGRSWGGRSEQARARAPGERRGEYMG
ncbi:hypothetical protein QBC41DRAFT_344206 [Cercophora samala]|uniref:RING-type domain-containing protein n=1 Tax=Cercophora samala TaxID=330535 RepID=A0AA39ZJZ5_9PEZI|nr:hypothetical protein QBC41DRAFT_344206 [Cercophora samala]